MDYTNKKQNALIVKVGDVIQSSFHKDTKFIVLEVHLDNMNTTIVMRDGILESDSVDYGWLSKGSKIVDNIDVKALRVLYGLKDLNE